MTRFFNKLFFGFCYIIFITPMMVQNFFAWVVAILWFDIFRIRRKVAIENIQKSFPDWSQKNVLKAARTSLFHMGKAIIDFFILAWINKEQMSQRVVFEGLENIDVALKQKKGVLLLGLHLSNGDFGIAALAGLGYDVHLISKRMSHRWLDQIWFLVRGRFGTKFIEPRNSSIEILRALRGNALVIFVLDQFMGPPLGVKTTFFGRPTGTAMGLALFAERTQAPVLPCYAHLLENGQYKVVFGKAIPFEDSGDKKINLQCMTQKYNDTLEDIVRRYPEQWMWIHRRWKAFNE